MEDVEGGSGTCRRTKGLRSIPDVELATAAVLSDADQGSAPQEHFADAEPLCVAYMAAVSAIRCHPRTLRPVPNETSRTCNYPWKSCLTSNMDAHR